MVTNLSSHFAGPAAPQTTPRPADCPASDNVVQAIQDMLAAGDWQPGQKIPSQRQLALRLGISRPTVREALVVLETMGRLRTRPGRGVYLVAAGQASGPAEAGQTARTPSLPSGAKLTQVYQFRYVIEPAIAGLVAQNATGAQIEDLRSLAAGMRGALQRGDLPLLAQLNFSFHKQLVEAANNPFFTKAIAPAMDLFFESQKLQHADETALEASVGEHEALAQALATRSSAKARKAMRNHILGAASRAEVAFALKD